MTRVRVYELARELGLETREMLQFLAQHGVALKSPSSSVDHATAEAVKELIREQRRKERKAEREVEAGAEGEAAVKEEAEAPEEGAPEAIRKPRIVQAPKPAPAEAAEAEVAAGRRGPTIVRRVKPTPEPAEAKPAAAEPKPARKPAAPPKKAPARPEQRVPAAERPAPPAEPIAPAAAAEAKPTPAAVPVPPAAPEVEKPPAPPPAPEPVPAVPARGEIVVPGPVTVRELAGHLDLRPEDAVALLLRLGIAKPLNQMLTVPEIERLAAQQGYGVRVEEKAEAEPAKAPAPEPVEKRPDLRYVGVPPVVAVLGHVDHGKTTLLDFIRRTDVTAREHGGITQHIGASELEYQGKRIVFIDTPGHEAFTELRARGAQVTDLVLLVVAADDGVMPQTLEALRHAKAAQVPVIAVVNKVDLENANPQQVRTQLAGEGLVPEEWGGDTIYVDVSARTGQGVENLLQMILLVAEMQELKAPVNVPGAGVVIEAKLDPARGPVATLLVKEGRIRKGDTVISGLSCGRIRRMTDWLGTEVRGAPPGKPVEVCGLNDVPRAGARLEVVPDPRRLKTLVRDLTEQRKREAAARQRLAPVLVEGEGGAKELLIVVKADTQGSLEAVVQVVEGLGNEEVKPRVVCQGVGNVVESDVLLASASQAMLVGFNVRADAVAQRLARQEGVTMVLYPIIYELIEGVRAALEGILEPEYREVLIGRVEVRRLFYSARAGTIAGCYVTEGRVTRGAQIRVLRDGEVLYTGALTSLRHLQDDVRQLEQGFECGIALEGFNDFREGDIVEVYEEEQVARTLT